MPNIEYRKKVFSSAGGTNEIYEAEYCGVPCFAVVHVPTGHIEVIDHNKNIAKATVNTVMAYLYGVIGGAGTEKKQ